MNETLKPVRTREDCINWLKREEVDLEVFAAFTGAQKYFREYDFSKDLLDEGGSLIDGTVLANSEEGEEPFVGRESFLEIVLMFVTWRICALAERAGVVLDMPDIPLPPGCKTAQEALSSSHWAPWAGGTARTITQAEFKTLPKDVQRAMRQAAKTGQVVKANV